MFMQMAELGAIMVAAMLGAVAIIALLQSRMPAQGVDSDRTVASGSAGMVFLFQNDRLIDASSAAWSLLDQSGRKLNDLDAMIVSFTGDFPTLRDRLADTSEQSFTLCSESDPTVSLVVQRVDDRLRVSLRGDDEWMRDRASLRLTCDASNDEQSLMRSVTAHATQLIWHEDRDGHLLWANAAYARALRDLGVKSLWDGHDRTGTQQAHRIKVTDSQGEMTCWFDVFSRDHAGGQLHFATDISEIMRAGADKQEFVKTLGRTFAELSIGLAIFDKTRKLAMFNPAFLDMTHLPADFLTATPVIDSVLDRLRELRMMPEPKNYTTWREQFTAVENGAKDGTYSKNWTLADGQTYRVTGRPYPDGAFALLFEDISAEVSLTRRFRLDIETGQAVLDTLDDAIAVFSSAGTLVMSNRAYAELWSDDPEKLLEHRVLQSEMKTWQDHCIPTPMWGEMRDFIQQLGASKPWSDRALLDDGRQLSCHAHRLAGGMTMVRFDVVPPKRPEITKLLSSDATIRAAKR